MALSNASQWMRSNGDNDDGDRGFMGLQKNWRQSARGKRMKRG